MSDKPRSFRHLKADEIREIIAAHQQGTPKSEIARQFNIDNTTVRYHVNRFERNFSFNTNVFAVIPVVERKPCQHPSLKCLVCGVAQDILRRRELDIIRELQTKLDKANAILRRHDLLME